MKKWSISSWIKSKLSPPDQELDYDYLIIASGATHAYFGHEEWEPLAPGLKTIEDALEIRRRVLLAFELAERQAPGRYRHCSLSWSEAARPAWNSLERWPKSPIMP